MAESVYEIIERIKKEEDVFSKAKLIGYVLKEKNLKVSDLAKHLGINSSYVCHFNRLNTLPDIIVDGYYAKLISVSHLFVISRVKDRERLTSIYEKVLRENLTVIATEELIREHLYQVNSKGNYLNLPEKELLIKTLNSRMPDVDIKIIQTRIKSKLIFEVKGSLEKSSRIIKQILKSV